MPLTVLCDVLDEACLIHAIRVSMRVHKASLPGTCSLLAVCIKLRCSGVWQFLLLICNRRMLGWWRTEAVWHLMFVIADEDVIVVSVIMHLHHAWMTSWFKIGMQQ